ncbi:MAG: hypothetical protein MK089_08765 [Phycisphaerales bacterium]|nr:hypothetical protein [Phycisphaerales bacterium]
MPQFLTIFGALVTSGSVGIGAFLAPDYDPTDPSQVAEREAAPDTPPSEDLSGPSVDDRDITNRGRGRNPSMGQSATTSVEGLLQARCANCHGPKKQKAGVQVMPVESIFTGPETDWVVLPGKPEESLLIERMVLPAGHDDIMPPSGEPMTKEEVALISNWIKNGAKPEEARRQVGGSMNGMGSDGRRSRGVNARVWMQIYLKLDLTKEQRASAVEKSRSMLRETEAFQAEYGARIRAIQQKVRSFEDRSNPTEELINLRKELQTLQAKQPNVAAAQELLWKALTTEQQAEMRKLLAEPESRRGNRGRGERGRGMRPDSDERGETPRERRRRLLEERRKAREREEASETGSDPDTRD